MDPAPELRSVKALLSVALVMERAAASRYAALAQRMAEREQDDLADLFTRLGRLERDHARFLERRLAGHSLPPETDAAGPESPDLDEEASLTPQAVLRAALRSEERAQAHFERIAATAGEAAVRRLAAELAAEEAEHAARIAAALARHTGTAADRGEGRGTLPAV